MNDVLTDWIRVTRAHGVVLARNLLPPRWGVRLEARSATVLHTMVRGSGWLLVDGQAPLQLSAGDVVLLPRGCAHALVADLTVTPAPLAELLASADIPHVGPSCATLVCCEYRTDTQVDGAMLNALPEVVHFPQSRIADDPAMAAMVALLVNELEHPKAGSDTLGRHLLDALFIYVLRAWGATRACDRGWLSGLNDPALSRALARIHEEPDSAWTVDALAKVAHLSRAAFARRFAERLGEPPMEYLTRWRMTIAARLLADGAASISEVAQKVGYTSEFAFSRAFKRARGIAPAHFRRDLAS